MGQRNNFVRLVEFQSGKTVNITQKKSTFKFVDLYILDFGRVFWLFLEEEKES